MSSIITRTEYMDRSHNGGMAAHREYYAQFVTERVKNCVLRVFTLEQLLGSKDAHLNDVGTMAMWDGVSGTYGFEHGGKGKVGTAFNVSAMLRAAGEGCSACTMVCIAKEAARQLIEAHNAKQVKG